MLASHFIFGLMRKGNLVANRPKFSLWFVFCLVSIFLLPSQQSSAQVTLTSPSGNVSATISVDGTARLQYALNRQGGTVLEPSPLGITVDGVDLGTEVSEISATPPEEVNRTYDFRGVKPTATDHYNKVTLTVSRSGGIGDASFIMHWRAYDDGVAYRYQILGSGTRTIDGERSSWTLPAGTQAWYQTKYPIYEGDFTTNTVPLSMWVTTPVTCILPSDNGNAGGYAVILEGALYNYPGILVQPYNGTRNMRAYFLGMTWEMQAGDYTPWRITLAAPTLNDLVNSTIVHSVNPDPAPELANAGWIQPGRSLWSWWAYGTHASDQDNYIDAAELLGFEYVLWDEGWDTWGDVTFNNLLQYARDRGIGVWLWRESSRLSTHQERVDFFSWIQGKNNDMGKRVIVGVKIDFMNNEGQAMMQWYEDTLADAADYELMVNFHGANKPTGYDRQYPHEMTREGVKGLEYNIWGAVPPHHNAALPFTRLLAGHADYTPVTFWDERLAGTTYAHQLAMAFLLTSPVTHWADDPVRYLSSPARDVIEASTTCWDETVVLPQSEIGELALMARRKGNRWFLSAINGNASSSHSLNADLTFLAGQQPYDAVLLGDNTSSPSFVRTEQRIYGNSSLSLWMRHGGGFVGMFTPVELKYPDFDEDGDVDQSDFGHIQVCLTGENITPPADGCDDSDLDQDEDIDSDDLDIFYGCLSGPNVLYDTDCVIP
jgi:alpha-glucosidase